MVGINADYNKVLDEYKRSVADLKMIENNFEQYRQKKEQYLVAILVKLHFIPSELSLLLGVGSQQITNIRSKINSKLFGKSGAKTLDANIWRI